MASRPPAEKAGTGTAVGSAAAAAPQSETNEDAALRHLLDAIMAAKDGDFTVRLSVDEPGVLGEICAAYNDLVRTNARTVEELIRVARLVGGEGRVAERFAVGEDNGSWALQANTINDLIDDLVRPTSEAARVIVAVAEGDLTQKMALDIGGQPVRGEFLRIGTAVNRMVEQLSALADEVTRVAREVGTEGQLGGQAEVEGASGIWKDLTTNVNSMASNLTNQVRNIATVTTAVAKGDLTTKITVEARGEIRELKDTINTMVDQLSSFANEVTRVAHEVGTEGKLGGQAEVAGVSGIWRDLTKNVNSMASSLTAQVRDIAQVTTAVARGDLSRKIMVDVQGEMLALKDTINTMVDQLSSFANEVTRVAREVGTEGKLGGQAEVRGVSGTWKALTEHVNQLAANLTTQVRAIADVSTAVTRGDLSRQITVEAQGEVAELKDNLNQMIANLRETTQKNAEQDWLKSNLARISGMMQGQRDLQTLSQLVMSELTPTVGAQHGAFFLTDPGTEEGDGEPVLELVASYGYLPHASAARRFRLGEGLVGQAALEKTPIVITEPPPDYIRVASGLGEASPANIIIMPLLFEGSPLGVIELATLRPFTEIDQIFLQQVTETIGVVVNTIIANTRTEELLEESQRLTQELRTQSRELQHQQEELRQTNAELEEKARLLAEQNRSIEVKNREIEMARLSLEEKAEQLALNSKYKSEFLANMSHELRTPLNSLLLLARLLADNEDGTLTDKQIEYARTIHAAGSDLLDLINDILDLSKVEAGKMDVVPSGVRFEDITAYVDQSFRPLAVQKDLDFTIDLAPSLPNHIVTDEQRLQQVLKNLLSNAFKFTDEGGVRLRIEPAGQRTVFREPALIGAELVVGFAVSDTGVGIAPDTLNVVFEAFQQADGATSRRHGGTGLGLSICREIARLLGGEVHAESKEGAGSTFTLYLPDTFRSRQTPGEPVAFTGTAERQQRTVTPRTVRSDEAADDRSELSSGHRRLLVVSTDESMTTGALDQGRARGYKVLVASHVGTALAMTRELRPDAILLDLDLEQGDGMAVLTHLKEEPSLRHIPVQVWSGLASRRDALRAGAQAFHVKPVEQSSFDDALARLFEFAERGTRRILVVVGDDERRAALVDLVGDGDDVEVVDVATIVAAFETLATRQLDCVLLDIDLANGKSFGLLARVGNDPRFRDLPVVVYTDDTAGTEVAAKLREYADALVVKVVTSLEGLVDETALFLHRSQARLPAEKRRMIDERHATEAGLEGKRVLIADDDVRNVFALTSVLERHGIDVLFAEDGRAAIAALEADPDVDLVLMDIMMPGMDGYETMRAIRAMAGFEQVPIIALTAQAMKGDREKSVAAGASDYIAKPVHIDELVSLLGAWLSGDRAHDPGGRS
jgi:signal transduction histidine kinase/DNA-binding response OmpR family regulator/HAMP domain-containing protein